MGDYSECAVEATGMSADSNNFPSERDRIEGGIEFPLSSRFPLNIPAWKKQDRRMTLQCPGKLLGALHAQIDALTLNR
jgi:hypothetical protein